MKKLLCLMLSVSILTLIGLQNITEQHRGRFYVHFFQHTEPSPVLKIKFAKAHIML